MEAMEEIKRIVEAGSALLWNTPSAMPFMVVLLLFTGVFLVHELAVLFAKDATIDTIV